MKPVYEPLPFKEIGGLLPEDERVLFFNPAQLYERHSIEVYSRSQKRLSFPVLFPQSETGICACGCGKPLSGRRRRWASDPCSKFAVNVWRIIDGQVDTVKYFIKLYNKGTRRCDSCSKGRMRFELDHRIPVHAGGGGCWLSNYQRLCKACHQQKTKEDFKSLVQRRLQRKAA
jgi:5-methylcytosine-specific restriction endonuclease McrA